MTLAQADDGLLSVALTAAVEAGDHFQVRIDAVKDVKTKSSPADLVTNVDPECEAMIRRRVHAAFPHHILLGEEGIPPGAAASVAATASAAAADHLWIVDPLDGTTNFVHSMPLSVVSIAYAYRGVVQVGVVFDPYHDEVFFARRGQGAYRARRQQALAWSARFLPGTANLLSGAASSQERNSRRGIPQSEKGQDSDLWVPGLQASEMATDDKGFSPLPGDAILVSQACEIRQAIVASGFPARGRQAKERTEAGLKVVARARHVRALGAAALHLAWVASGRLDGFWEYDLNAWDVAAGMLLVQEAGGQATAVGGGPYSLQVRDVRVACTVNLGEELDSALIL